MHYPESPKVSKYQYTCKSLMLRQAKTMTFLIKCNNLQWALKLPTVKFLKCPIMKNIILFVYNLRSLWETWKLVWVFSTCKFSQIKLFLKMKTIHWYLLFPKAELCNVLPWTIFFEVKLLLFIPLRAKWVGKFIEIRHKKIFTHRYTEYPWVSGTLSLCDYVTLWPIFPKNGPCSFVSVWRYFNFL